MIDPLEPARESVVSPAESDGFAAALAGNCGGLLEALPRDYEGDLAWYSHALRLLARLADVNEESDSVDVSRVLLDTCVVAALTHEFHRHLDQAGPPGDWRYVGWDDVSGPGGVGLIELGRVCEVEGVEGPPWTEAPEQTGPTMLDYIDARWTTVSRALREELTDAGLLVGLWGARTGVDSPFDDDAWDVVNAPTTEALVGYDWIIDGPWSG